MTTPPPREVDVHLDALSMPAPGEVTWYVRRGSGGEKKAFAGPLRRLMVDEIPVWLDHLEGAARALPAP